ncbi:hypothetical protein SCALM49S_04506 [Streptomyces californicus]
MVTSMTVLPLSASVFGGGLLVTTLASGLSTEPGASCTTKPSPSSWLFASWYDVTPTSPGIWTFSGWGGQFATLGRCAVLGVLARARRVGSMTSPGGLSVSA